MEMISMKINKDIHNVEARAKVIYKNIGDLEYNKEHIINFLEHIKTDVSKVRVIFYANRLKKLSEYLGKDFKEATEKDLRNVVYHIQNNGYTEQTIHSFLVSIKRFYKWLDGNDKTYPEKVAFIKITRIRKTKEIDEILTINEVRELVRNANSIRNKAVIYCLYSSGARVGEFLQMKIKHVKFEKDGIWLHIPEGKTSSREIPLDFCFKEMTDWLSSHPLKDDPDAPLWITKSDEKYYTLSYQRLREILKETAKISRIKKRVYPHLLRHSRLTKGAKDGWSEYQLKLFAGWTKSSDMAEVYIHMSGRDLKTLRNGIDVKPKKDVIVCPRCKIDNNPNNKFCSCGLLLDMRYAIQEQASRETFGKFFKLLHEQAKHDPNFKEQCEAVFKKMGN